MSNKGLYIKLCKNVWNMPPVTALSGSGRHGVRVPHSLLITAGRLAEEPAETADVAPAMLGPASWPPAGPRCTIPRRCAASRARAIGSTSRAARMHEVEKREYTDQGGLRAEHAIHEHRNGPDQ